jgi:hypothetical protein
LTIGHITPHKSGSSATPEDLLVECARCNESVGELTGPQLGREQVWDRIRALPNPDRKVLLAWMMHDARPLADRDRAWGAYRQLPAALREQVRRDLYDLLNS